MRLLLGSSAVLVLLAGPSSRRRRRLLLAIRLDIKLPEEIQHVHHDEELRRREDVAAAPHPLYVQGVREAHDELQELGLHDTQEGAREQ